MIGMILIGVIFAAGAILMLTLGIHEEDGFLIGAGGFIFVLGLVLIVSGAGMDSIKDRSKDAAKICAPYQVTHKHENDGYYVFSCANDNRIRVLKK